MSTRATLILTNQNEHCYIEQNAPFYEDCKTDTCIVLEFDTMHKVETDEDGTRVIIEEGTEMYKYLIAARFPHECL